MGQAAGLFDAPAGGGRIGPGEVAVKMAGGENAGDQRQRQQRELAPASGMGANFLR